MRIKAPSGYRIKFKLSIKLFFPLNCRLHLQEFFVACVEPLPSTCIKAIMAQKNHVFAKLRCLLHQVKQKKTKLKKKNLLNDHVTDADVSLKRKCPLLEKALMPSPNRRRKRKLRERRRERRRNTCVCFLCACV